MRKDLLLAYNRRHVRFRRCYSAKYYLKPLLIEIARYFYFILNKTSFLPVIDTFLLKTKYRKHLEHKQA